MAAGVAAAVQQDRMQPQRQPRWATSGRALTFRKMIARFPTITLADP